MAFQDKLSTLLNKNISPWGNRNNDKGDKNTKGNSPWGAGSGGGSGGSGGGSSGGGQGPDMPDFDAMARKLKENFGGFGGMGVGSVIAIILMIWLATGLYRVLPEEHGVILRFGEWQRTVTQPGLGYHLPWPIDTIIKPNVTFERRIEVGFRDAASNRGRAIDVKEESLMLTGDENIIDIDFVVLWKVGDARNFLFNIRNPEDTIKKVAESAMREVIGQTNIQPALTGARGEIQSRTRELMQDMLDSYEAGVLISDIQMQKVDPPAPVVDAFNDVQRARADRERLRNEAETYRNDIIPRARGDSEKLLQEAEAYKEEIVNRAQGDAARFNSVYAAYNQARDVTAQRLYIETMEDVLQNSQKIIIDHPQGGMGVLPYLSLDELKKRR